MSYRVTKRGKLIPADSKKPHNCVVLAIDTATRSGWALFRRGMWLESGELIVSSAEQIQTIVVCALGYGRASAIPTVIVFEKPFARNPATVMALGAARKAWESTWDQLAKPHRQKGHVVEVYPQTWRSRILGVTSGDKVPELERANALLLTNRAPGPDEAAAVCIGAWATTAGEVARVLPQAFWGAS